MNLPPTARDLETGLFLRGTLGLADPIPLDEPDPPAFNAVPPTPLDRVVVAIPRRTLRRTVSAGVAVLLALSFLFVAGGAWTRPAPVDARASAE